MPYGDCGREVKGVHFWKWSLLKSPLHIRKGTVQVMSHRPSPLFPVTFRSSSDQVWFWLACRDREIRARVCPPSGSLTNLPDGRNGSPLGTVAREPWRLTLGCRNRWQVLISGGRLACGAPGFCHESCNCLCSDLKLEWGKGKGLSLADDGFSSACNKAE